MSSMKVKLKVCGMKDYENILQVGELLPDYMGFIFYENSPRFVGHHFILPPSLDNRVSRVGVFVNLDAANVIELVGKYKLDFVQVHGDESHAYCSNLKNHNIKIIKVFRVDEQFDFVSTKEFEDLADYFLFDTKGKLYGGNSVPFNWRLLEKYNQRVPFFLSGGLHSSHMLELGVLSKFNIHGVDVNSGVEDKPGLKNNAKIQEIINQLSV
jgi:phosphoribosylanthranilate isomerase